jgi:uncharacterized CHY-type Zn-finger protein
MSGSDISVKCRVCKTYASIYTGNAEVQDFENHSWDGASVEAICDECQEKEWGN